VKPFVKRRRGGFCATFEPNEAQLLVGLSGQVVELLRDRTSASESDPDPLASELGIGGPLQPPQDPVLLRLLPDAYRDAPEDAAEFRRFTEQSLTSVKVANAEAIIGTLVEAGFDPAAGLDGQPPIEVELPKDLVQAWLRGLTDVRLALAVRLGIEDDSDHEIIVHSADEALAAMAEVYDWVGFVQESLVEALH
jgi:hypothetical protein